MDLKRLIGIILIPLYLSLASGCVKRVSIIEPENYWWTEGTAWIKAENYDKWIQVIKVEADSVYGTVPGRSRLRHEALVTIHLSSVEVIKKQEDNSFETLIAGIAVGTLFGIVVLILHISHSFGPDSL